MKKRKIPAAPSLVIANWGRRLTAWFIDYSLVNVILAYFQLEQIEGVLMPFLLPRLPGVDISIWSPLSILFFFLYWTLMEWYFGRSIGQLLLNLRLVDRKGSGVSLRASAVQSLGKSLLLPVDCLIGLAYSPSRGFRQRFLQRLSNTIVIYLGSAGKMITEGGYAREP